MTIDIHGHITPPELLKRFPMPASLGDIEGMIGRKAALGIELTIVGSPVGVGTMVPVPGLDNYDQPADRIDAFHEWVAETVRAHPRHLRAYAYINPYASDDSLDRVAKRLAQEEFVGLIVNTSVRGEYLDSPRAEGVFALAAETGCPILLHPPAEPVGAAAMRGRIGLVEHVARPCDVTAGVAAILFAGWLDRYPTLKLIAANAGGALPLLVEKLDLAQRRAGPGGPGGPGAAPGGPGAGPGGPGAGPGRPGAGPGGPGAGPGGPGGPGAASAERPMSESLRRIWVDTATPSALALAAALQVFGPGRLLFGTDSPPLATPLDAALALVDGLSVDAGQRGRIRATNARELFGLDREESS